MHTNASEGIGRNHLIELAKKTGLVGAVPEGWQLVPNEPTDEMKKSYVKEFGYPSYGVGHEYKFMLAAAPKPEEVK